MRRMAAAIMLMALLLTPFAAPGNTPDAAIAKSATKPKKPLAKPNPPAVPARQLFGAAATPAPLAARAIGFYARGCLSGAKPLAIDGPAWQAMRLSRNRNWGHPQLVKLVERLATEAKAQDGWRGLLVGDMSQPRGGPMLTGHASHQVGLDADIWLTPMPDRRLSEKEREELSATSMLAADGLSVDPRGLDSGACAAHPPRRFLPGRRARARAPGHQEGAVRGKGRSDRACCTRSAPTGGTTTTCTSASPAPRAVTIAKAQPSPPSDDGCGKELDDWMARIKVPPRPDAKPAKPKPPLTLAQLPAECKVVLEARSKDVVEAKPQVLPEAGKQVLPEAGKQEPSEAKDDAKRAHGPAGANPKQ